METTSAGKDRIIKRWARCPGWDPLLDRANEVVRIDTNNWHNKNGRLSG